MKKSEYLFYLIKSLSKAEKIGFKVFAKSHTQQQKNNYTILFDAIDSMNKYNQDRLIKKVSNRIPKASIPTLKMQLRQLILKSLRNSQSISSPREELYLNRDYISILFEKRLYDQCRVLLNKTKEQAWKMEEYIIVDELSIFEYKLAVKESNPDALSDYIDNTFHEVKKARALNDELAEMERLTAQMRLLLFEGASVGGGLTEKKLDKIISNPLMKVNPLTRPLQFQIDQNVIWGHYYYVSGNGQKTYEYRKKVVELTEKRNNKVIDRIWISHVRFMLVGLATYNMFDEYNAELEAKMNFINSIPSNKISTSIKQELESTIKNLEFNLDLEAYNFNKISTYIEDLEKDYLEQEVLTDSNLKLAYRFNFSYAHIANGNIKRALFWYNELQNDKETRNIREDIHANAIFLGICIHFQLGNYGLMESLILSSKRFLSKVNRKTELANAFLSFANRHLTQPYSVDKREVFEKEYQNWKEIIKRDKESQFNTDYFEVTLWLKCIYEGMSMEEIQKEK